MTTIAFKAGIMASDTNTFTGTLTTPWARKLMRGNDGVLHGITGDYGPASTYLEWVATGYLGAEPLPKPIGSEDESNFAVLICKPKGSIYVLDAHGRTKFIAPFYAIGAGALVAFGALHAGASAIEAIEAANIYCSNSGGEIRSISFGDDAQ